MFKLLISWYLLRTASLFLSLCSMMRKRSPVCFFLGSWPHCLRFTPHTHTFPPTVIRVCLAVKAVGETVFWLVLSLIKHAHAGCCSYIAFLVISGVSSPCPIGGQAGDSPEASQGQRLWAKGHTLEPASFFSLQLCEEGSACLSTWLFFNIQKSIHN